MNNQIHNQKHSQSPQHQAQQQPVKQKKGSAPVGCLLATTGIIGCTIGAAISATGIGALLGIPIIIVCTPLLLYGGALFGRAFRK